MKKILLLSLLLLVAMAITIPARAINQATVVNLETGHRKAVNVGDSHAFDNNYELEIDYGVKLISEEELGFSVVSSYKTTLSASMTSTQSTINASSVTSKDDTTLSMAILGERAYLTIEPGGSKEEIVMCTGISGTAWTGCTRGLAFTGTSTAAVAANRKTHSAGSTLIMSNVHYVYDELVDKDTAETIAGIKTFSSYPLIETYVAPTANEQFAPKKYVDDVISSGASDATETAKGISELATAAEAALGTSSGSAARLVLPASIASSSNDVAGAKVVVSEADGYINQNRLDLSEDFAFSGDNTFTGDNTYAGIATTSGQSIFTATSTYSGVLPTSDINPSNDDDLVRKGYLGWDLGANGTNDYFTVQIPCIEDVMTIDNVTFTEEGGFCTVEGIAANWNIETRYLMGKGSESNLQYDDTGIVSMQVRLRAVNGVTGNRRWGFGHPAGFDDIIHDDLTQKSVQFGAIGTELVALAINGTANTVMPITGYTVTDWNLYEIEWDLTNDTAKFYVNGTLEITLSTTTPTTADDVSWGTGGTADTEDSDVSNIMYRMEL